MTRHAPQRRNATRCAVIIAAIVGLQACAPSDGVSTGSQVGQRPDDFTLRDPRGNEHTLADQRGRIVILDFWATWCAPCLEAMPHLQRIHEAHGDRDVTVLGMSFAEHNGDPDATMKRLGCTYTVLLDADRLGSRWGVQMIPEIVVIDQQGIVAERILGAHHDLEQQLDAIINRLRVENSTTTH